MHDSDDGLSLLTAGRTLILCSLAVLAVFFAHNGEWALAAEHVTLMALVSYLMRLVSP